MLSALMVQCYLASLFGGLTTPRLYRMGCFFFLKKKPEIPLHVLLHLAISLLQTSAPTSTPAATWKAYATLPSRGSGSFTTPGLQV